MKRTYFLLLLILAVGGGTYAQTDTMVFETGGTLKKYLVSNIAQITFVGSVTMTGDEITKANALLKSFALHQNYPNPFNPTTNISYRLPERGLAKVRVFDSNGKLVKDLLSGIQEAGEHNIVWDSRNVDGHTVASGVYFYQVQFNSSELTKKMIFLK